MAQNSGEEMHDAPASDIVERDAVVIGWSLANEIVQARFQTAAIDAIPIFASDHGLERFLFTRRLACEHHQDDSPDAFGTLRLCGGDAPYLIQQDEQIALGPIFRDAPERAVKTTLERVSAPDLGAGNHASCWHTRAAHYPLLYQAISELIADYPEMTAAREVFVDDQHVDNTYHPLYLHGVVTQPGVVYDWFSVESGEHSVFIRINADQVFHQTDRGTWRAAGPLLHEATLAEVKLQIRSWLRLP